MAESNTHAEGALDRVLAWLRATGPAEHDPFCKSAVVREGLNAGGPKLYRADVRALAEQLAAANAAIGIEKARCASAEKLMAADHKRAEEAEAIIARVGVRMAEYDRHGSGMVNVRQVINLLSPTWPDGNYSSEEPTYGPR